MPATKKNVLLVIGSILVIAASGAWIYYQQYKAPKYNVSLHQRVGEVMAEQTAHALGTRGRILLITIPTAGQPELETQLTAFRLKLKTLGDFHIKDHEVDSKDQPKYGAGTGLSGRRFVRAVNGHAADAVVSFIGVPELSDEQLTQLTNKLPKFIAESRSPDHLPKLFEKKVLYIAVVSRFNFPAPGPVKPSTAQEWFDKRYQVVAAGGMPELPKAE